MKFSFILPVYKTEQYLARCLDSLVQQTDGDFEAIVVDDCSPREESKSKNGVTCSEIVARYDARFRYVRQDRNRSTFQAKATGAKLATGEYIVPLDSDDYVLPRLVEELKKGIGGENRWRWTKDVRSVTSDEDVASPDTQQSKNPTIQQSNNIPLHLHLFSPPDVVIYQMAKEFRNKVYPVKYNHPAGHCSGAEALEKLFAGRIFMPVCGKAIRREVFLAAYEGLGVGPDFYLNFTDDLCWLLPILLNTKTVAFIDYLGYRYWRHEDSMTKDVMAPEKVRLLAAQSQRSIAAVVAYAEKLGAAARESRAVRKNRSARDSRAPSIDNRLIAEIRAQIYPTIRWLLRDMHEPRALLEDVYGADLVAEALRWDAASGGKLAKLFRHLRTYGFAATAREILARARGEEI